MFQEIFRTKHLSPMLNVLLFTLIEGKHKLLTDEILSAVFHIAAINFEIFYNNYIPSLLASSGSLTGHQIHTLRTNFNLQTVKEADLLFNFDCMFLNLIRAV